MTDELDFRTARITYSGPEMLDDLFDDLVDLFESHGLTIEVATDGPTEDEYGD